MPIGVPADMPGATAETPGREPGVAAGFTVRDAGGGAAGAAVAAADRRDKPDAGATVARRRLDRDGAHAVVGPTFARIAAAREHDRAATAGAAASRGLTGPARAPVPTHPAGDAHAPTRAGERDATAAIPAGCDGGRTSRRRHWTACGPTTSR